MTFLKRKDVATHVKLEGRARVAGRSLKEARETQPVGTWIELAQDNGRTSGNISLHVKNQLGLQAGNHVLHSIRGQKIVAFFRISLEGK